MKEGVGSTTNALLTELSLQRSTASVASRVSHRGPDRSPVCLLDEHRAAMLLESVVEEVLSAFISGGHIEVSRLTLGVGRAKLAAALAQLYRDVRGQCLSLEELTSATVRVHANEYDHAPSLADLARAMSEFLSVPRRTEAAEID